MPSTVPQHFDRPLLPAYEDVLQVYQQGAFEETLRLFAAVDLSKTAVDCRILTLLANANLKLKQPAVAADIYARLADVALEQRPLFLKIATTLYLQIGADEKVAAIGPDAVSANSDNSTLAFDVVMVMGRLGRLAEAEPLLRFLDRSSPQHFVVASTCYQRLKQPGRAYGELVDGAERFADDLTLHSLLYAKCRAVCDFPRMRSFDALMSDLTVPFAQAVFNAQSALNRLYWCDDERLQMAPSLDSEALRRTASVAGSGNAVVRRPVSPKTEKLRIGYLSNDFGNFVVNAVLEEVLKLHDRDKFDIRLFCYTTPGARAYQKGWPDHLRNEVVPIDHLSDREAADIIASEKIDVLIDLKGHTQGGRLNIMRLTDAPVTASYLGYPGTIAGAEIDYVISDRIVTPDSSRPHYLEKLCRLPEVQMPNKAFRALSACKRPDWGLPSDSFVFASFNAVYKMTPRTIDLWGRILCAVPNSILWMTCRDTRSRSNLRAEFIRLGVDPERIVFIDKIASYDDHISRIGLADIALDILPYNGHSTSADILRAGVPLVTVKGKSYHSRVSWGLLEACGVGELAADDDEHYISLAVHLAHDPDALRTIRKRLEENNQASPIFDPQRMARHLERAFEMMADRARQGLPPDHMDVPPLPR